MPDEPAPGSDATAPRITFLGKRGHNPLWQGLAVLLAASIAMAIAHTSIGTIRSIWLVAATFLLFFTAANPLLGIFKHGWGRYLALSVPVYAGLTVAIIFLAKTLSGTGLGEIAEFRAFFALEALFYVIVTGLVGIYRLVLSMITEMK
jgi:hypothetical protein